MRMRDAVFNAKVSDTSECDEGNMSNGIITVMLRF